MPTPNERKGLWFLALVAVSGTAVRVWRGHAPAPSAVESVALQRQIGRVDSARTAARERRAKRPARASRSDTVQAANPQPADPGPVDLDRADAAAIETLPGIGPSLARRIVAQRDTAGAFGGMERLCQVRGVGPALAERLRPLVTFGGRSSPLSDACRSASKTTRKRPAERGRERS